MLRYDTDGERDFHDDFGWLDITHGLTYANAARWLQSSTARRTATWCDSRCGPCSSPTGRAATSGTRASACAPRSSHARTDLAAYGRALQHEALLDGTSAFIVHAHAVKMSVAATEEALRLGDTRPLDATARFIAAPKLERFVAATVTRSIDFLSGKARSAT